MSSQHRPVCFRQQDFFFYVSWLHTHTGLREDRDGQLAKMEEEIVVTSTSRSVCSTFIGCGSRGAQVGSFEAVLSVEMAVIRLEGGGGASLHCVRFTMWRGMLHCSPQDIPGSPLNMSTSTTFCHSKKAHYHLCPAVTENHSPGCPLCPASLAMIHRFNFATEYLQVTIIHHLFRMWSSENRKWWN